MELTQYTTSLPPAAPPASEGKGKGRTPPQIGTGANTTPLGKNSSLPSASPKPSMTKAQAIVLHAASTKYKPGQMRRWIEEDNRGSVQILEIRWLVQESRKSRYLWFPST